VENDYAEDVHGVRVVRWNPSADGGARVDNFGDLLGPLLTRRLVTSAAEHDARLPSLLTIGSIMQFAEPGDVVWGTGVNAKLKPRRLDPRRVFDVRAVRGPLTAVALESEGSSVPHCFGDPGVLLPALFPETVVMASPERKRHSVVVVPNVNDVGLDAAGEHVVRPTGEPWQVIEQLLGGELVVGTSLHAIITAEAYGVPARAVRSSTESPVKYVDYYEGTGRTDVVIAESVEEAIALGGVEAPDVRHRTALLDAFPSELWTGDPSPASIPVRSLATVVSELTERALTIRPGATRDSWREMARRIAVPVLRDRAMVLDDDELESVVVDVRRLDAAGMLQDVDERWNRTRELAKYRLGDSLRRSAILNVRGADSVLDRVQRAGEDGRLLVGGILQLPDGGLDAFTVSLLLANDQLLDRHPVDSVTWDEVQPTLGTVRWSAEVPLSEMRNGDWVLAVHIDGPGGPRDVVVRSAPTMTFPRWWHDGSPYRVDRTARGVAVIHKEIEAS